MDHSIAMANRERKLKWWLQRIRHMIASGRISNAKDMVEQALKELK